jgi:polyhydroxyalkanoate synthesis regulator phasin
MNGNDMDTVTMAEESPMSSEGLARNAYLAMLGAVGMLWDGWDDTVNRLVERGEELQGELQSRAQEARWENMRASSRMGDSLQMVTRALRDQLDIPSKSEIDAMNVKLNILLRKLDDLALRTETTTDAPEVPVAPPPEESPGSSDVT